MKFLLEAFLDVLCFSLYFCKDLLSTIYPSYVKLVEKFLHLLILNWDAWLADSQRDHQYFWYLNYVIFVGFGRKVKNLIKESYTNLSQAYVNVLFLVLKNKVEAFTRLREEEKTHVRLCFVLLVLVFFLL